MAEKDQRIVAVVPERQPRDGWAEASRLIAEAVDDALVWPEFGNDDDGMMSW